MVARSVDPTKPYAAGYNPSFSASAPPDSYEDGGAIEEDPVSQQPFKPVQMPQANVMGSQDALDTEAPRQPDDTSASINHALELVDKLLAYGRNKFGIGSAGGQEDKGAIPEAPSFEEGGEVEELPIQEPLADEDAARTMPQQSSTAPPAEVAPAPNRYSVARGRTNPTEAVSEGGSSTAQEPVGPLARPDTPAARIIAMLKGEGSDPATTAQYEQAAAQQTQDPGDMKLFALAMAAQRSPEDGLKVLQTHRGAYGASNAFAAAALDGNQQRPGSIEAAADAATKAYTNMPDGSNIKFAPTADGVTVTATRSGNQQPFLQTKLSTDQFRSWLRGPTGQFDNVLEMGGPNLIQQIAKQAGSTATTGAGERVLNAGEQATVGSQENVTRLVPTQNVRGADLPRGGGQQAQGAAPQQAAPYTGPPGAKPGSVQNDYVYDAKTTSRQFGEPNRNQIPSNASMGFDEDIDQRGNAAHPEDRFKAVNWKQAAQKERDNNKAKTDAAETSATGKIDAARTRAESQERIAQAGNIARAERLDARDRTLLQREVMKIEAQGAQGDKRNAINVLRSVLGNPMLSMNSKTIMDALGVLKLDPAVVLQHTMEAGAGQRTPQPAQEAPQPAPQKQATPPQQQTRDPRFYYDAQGNKIGRKG